jgi:hypothetical protein
MDSYDVNVYPNKFHLYVKESIWTFNIITNILNIIQWQNEKKDKRINNDVQNLHIKLKIE